MKKHSSIFLLISLFCFGPSALAVERTRVADTPENVIPLLNSQEMPDSSVFTSDGKQTSLKQLANGKPSLILFYRGGWCPYCNRQLASMRDIESSIITQGIQIIAISPDSPERLQRNKLSTESPITLVADPKLNAIRDFGLAFYLPDDVAEKYRNRLGAELASLDGEKRVVLPVPAAYFVDKDGVIVFNYVNPDYRVRVSADLLLTASQLVLN